MMYAAVTAGVLVKGPVMLAWAVGGSLGGRCCCARPPRCAGSPGTGLGARGGDRRWLVRARQRAFPEYPRYAFLEESVQRLSTGAFKREQPAWFVPAVLAAGALPWSLTTPWWSPRRAGGAPWSETARLGLGFVLFAAVFFTLSHSKLVTYLLPALPMLAWAAAERWSDPARLKQGA